MWAYAPKKETLRGFRQQKPTTLPDPIARATDDIYFSDRPRERRHSQNATPPFRCSDDPTLRKPTPHNGYPFLPRSIRFFSFVFKMEYRTRFPSLIWTILKEPV